MTNEEIKEVQILINYALTLGVFGEFSTEAKSLCEANKDNPRLFGPMVEIDLEYRKLLEQRRGQ